MPSLLNYFSLIFLNDVVSWILRDNILCVRVCVPYHNSIICFFLFVLCFVGVDNIFLILDYIFYLWDCNIVRIAANNMLVLFLFFLFWLANQSAKSLYKCNISVFLCQIIIITTEQKSSRRLQIDFSETKVFVILILVIAWNFPIGCYLWISAIKLIKQKILRHGDALVVWGQVRSNNWHHN